MLRETALANLHRELGGKMVDFSGWSMPVNYGSQIEEHHAVRQAAGMFDVSHMTVVDILGLDAKPYLQRLLANDVAKLQSSGKALYSAMLNDDGGVIDDLIVYLTDFGYRLVVNCGTRKKDLDWLASQAKAFKVTVLERPEMAMIAIQGPQARAKFDALVATEDQMRLQQLTVFSGCNLSDAQQDWFVARTGYTGEDGYEVILPEGAAIGLWQDLLDNGVAPCGLGARDTLRLEAGMNLYGHEMDDSISPLQANMSWTVTWQPERNFIGRAKLERERQDGVMDKLVGLVLRSRGVLRQGYTVCTSESERQGIITSGTFSPTLGFSIALARVPVATGQRAEVMIRGKAETVEVVPPCFVRNGKSVLQA